MHEYEVKFLVRAHVRTASEDLGEMAARVHCSAEAFVDPGDPPIQLEGYYVEWLDGNLPKNIDLAHHNNVAGREANERDEDGWIIRAIDTAGEKDVD